MADGDAHFRPVRPSEPDAIKRITLDMHAPMHRALRFSALDQDVPMADILRALIDLWLHDPTVRKKARAVLAGSGAPGPLLDS